MEVEKLKEERQDLGDSVVKAFIDFKRAEMSNMMIDGLSRSETRFLFVLFHAEKRHGKKLRSSDLGKRLRISKPSVTQTLQALENKGFVERLKNPEDKRSTYIVLTEKGQQAIKDGAHRFQSNFDDMKNYLGEENMQILIELLNKLTKYLHEKAGKEEA